MLFVMAFVFLLGLAALLAMDFIYETRLSHGSDVVNASVTITTDADGKIYSDDLAVGAGATVNYVGLTGPASNLKCYSFLPTFSGTMTVNYDVGGDDVITLTANKPIAWNNASGLSSHFTNVNNITSIDFNNSGASAGTIDIIIGRDVVS